MIIPDVNVLIHAYNRNSDYNEAALRWWERMLESKRPVGLSWATILGYVRLMTNRRVFENPLPVSSAIGDVKSWLEQPATQIVTPGEMHSVILFGLLERVGTAGDLTTDAHIAALAVEYQAEVATTDADFARFPGVRSYDPLSLKRRE